MKRYLYCRVSTGYQEFNSQKQIVEDYLDRAGHGISINDLEIVEEKIHGDADTSVRALQKLIDKTESGDIIYISMLTRWSRDSITGMYNLYQCYKKGVNVFDCSKGQIIDLSVHENKINIFVQFWSSEAELHRIRTASDAGIRKAKANGVKSGRANKKWCANKTTEEMEQMERERALSIAKTKTFQRLESVQLALIIRAIETAIPQISSCANKGSEFPFLGYEQFRRITMDEWSSIHRTYRAITEGNTNPLVDDKISLQKLKNTYYYVFQNRFKSTAVQFVKY